MQPVISEVKQITLLGVSFYGDPFDTHAGWDEDNQIGRLWKRLFALLPQSPAGQRLLDRCKATCEVHIYNAETAEKGLLEVFAGMPVSPEDLANAPVELVVKVLPPTRYAIFTFQGEEITSDWEKILSDWLAASGYRSPHSYNFQYYDERFKGLDRLAESVLDVYVPIEEAA